MSGDPIFEVRDLHVRFATPDGEVHAVRGASMHVDAGETVAVVGESGSGKSQIMMAAMGLLAKNGRATGSVGYRGQELIGLGKRRLDRIRGEKITMIFQEPMTSLDPLYRIGRQIAEPLVHHGGLSWHAARDRVIELLDLVQIPDPERRARAYPHELSGGQRQRVMIAMALANDPDLLIADEPTTALDVTIQAQILELLAEVKERVGLGILFITHDLNIVRRIAQRVYVMQAGQVVEEGPTERIFEAPAEPYTKILLDAEPQGRKTPPPAGAPTILEGRDVRVDYRIPGGLFRKAGAFQAVRGVDLVLRRGGTVGVVGESGSGKSTLGRALVGLLPHRGTVLIEGREVTLEHWDKALRRDAQMVFQDPYGSLSPRMTVGEIVSEGLLVHEPGLSRRERDKRAAAILGEVGLDPAMRRRYPHEFSGGQRQRIAIARAMILQPRLVVLDEPTSALDRTIQKQIVDLLRDLQARHGLAYLFISHDLAVVRAMSDIVLVMKEGDVVEQGPSEDIFLRPATDYARALVEAAALRPLSGKVEAGFPLESGLTY